MSGVRKNIRFVLVSQVLVLVLGVLKTLLIPVVLGVGDFAYWQVYVFYITYVGLFTFGFNDGIYLRYGGADYHTMDSARIRSSVRLYAIYLLGASALMLAVCSAEPDPSKRTVFYLASLNIIVMGMMAVFSFVLQATGRLQRFGVLNAVDKCLFLVFLLALFLFGARSFASFVVAELVSKCVALIFMFVSCSELIKGKGADWHSAFAEVRENVACGLKLMLANLSGMLVLGAGRMVIEYWGTLESYAFYAFGISMTNLALVALTSVSIVIYPALKRLPEDRYLHYYDDANAKLFIFGLLMLCGYFPVVWLIGYAIPKYTPVIPYLNVLFVVTVLQGKMQLLNNNYYKALRYEGQMLKANLESLAVAVVLSAALYALERSVMAIAVATLLTMAYRVFMSERFLRRAMGGGDTGMIRLEAGAYVAFIVITSTLDYRIAFLAFCCLLAAFAVYAKSEFQGLFQLVIKEKKR
jgi:O-antigen/teichoic acid export membrane protein